MEAKTVKFGVDVTSKNSHFKATYALREVRRQIAKHFKGQKYRIDNSLNEYFWTEGKSNAPNKVEVTAVKEGNVLTIFLAGSEAFKNFENKSKKVEKKEEKTEEKTAEKKAETKKTESKQKDAKTEKVEKKVKVEKKSE